VKGMRHGEGTAKFRTGEHHYRVYVGTWRRSMREGAGKECWPNDDVYEGEWKEDKFHGRGVLKSGTTKFAGGFEKGLKTGYGAMVFSSGNYYEGEFLKGR